jgi:hypothetical protein
MASSGPHVHADKWIVKTTALFNGVTIAEDGLIDIESFLQACHNIQPVYDIIFSPGIVASTLKSDIAESISSVTNLKGKYPKLAHLQALIRQELTDTPVEKLRKTKKSGVVGLLWLMRAITFNVTFIAHVNDGRKRPAPECAKEAYAQVLKPYHGMMLSGIVRWALRDFLLSLHACHVSLLVFVAAWRLGCARLGMRCSRRLR